MARLALFIAVDKERKLENEKRMPPPSRTVSNSNPSPISNQSSPPSSHTFSRSSSRSSQTEQLDPFTMALQDWETLQSDFRTWKIAIMAIKSIRVETNMPTPFGPALIYNDIRIAAAEMLYLAAQIHLTRAHPSTPSFPPQQLAHVPPLTVPSSPKSCVYKKDYGTLRIFNMWAQKKMEEPLLEQEEQSISSSVHFRIVRGQCLWAAYKLKMKNNEYG